MLRRLVPCTTMADFGPVPRSPLSKDAFGRTLSPRPTAMFSSSASVGRPIRPPPPLGAHGRVIVPVVVLSPALSSHWIKAFRSIEVEGRQRLDQHRALVSEGVDLRSQLVH